MKGFLGLGVGLVGANVVVGSVPNITGNATETNLKGNFSKGVSNIGTALPTYGKVVGAKATLKATNKLNKNKMFMKGGFSL